MNIINPQIAVERRNGTIDKVAGTVFEVLTQAKDECKVTGKWSPKRIMSIGYLRKSGAYKILRVITVDPQPVPPKTYA